jgi:8-oxo-dGTP pyrophosphatase MutT (NUDIX family)
MDGQLASLPNQLHGRLKEPPRVAPVGRSAAVAVLLAPATDGPQVLLMRRAERVGDRWSGQISLPGGFHQPADVDLLATALRETREELGIELSRDGRLLGALEIRAPVRQVESPVSVLPLVFWADTPPAAVLSEEAVEAFWLPLGSVRRGERNSTYRLVLPGRVEQHPAWTNGPHLIWGLTYRILSELLERLTELPPR